jgi:hypothetical protein
MNRAMPRRVLRYDAGAWVISLAAVLTMPTLWPHYIAIAQNPLPSTVPIFLVNPSTVDNSAAYRKATDAMQGGTRETLPKWKAKNGFSTDGTPVPNEAKAIYFNNGDLKLGRDMHCRFTSTGATACYVSNFGKAGQDDASKALAEAFAYEASHQDNGMHPPTATVAMEYDPTVADPMARIQFWAYDDKDEYLRLPVLDTQAYIPKPMPNVCMACHQGILGPGDKVRGAVFLPFDLDTFLDEKNTKFSTSNTVTRTVQEQFHRMNNMVLGTNPPIAIRQLIELWYPDGASPTLPFKFNQGAAQLNGAPFAGHEDLYNKVVKIACRSCHAAMSPRLNWTSFDQINNLSEHIERVVCDPRFSRHMPFAEVPWKTFWSQGLSATLATELHLPNGCLSN